MIDIEAHVFDNVYSAVVPGTLAAGCFKSEYVRNPASFPFATLIEIENITDVHRRGSELDEQFAVVAYEANAYALSQAECKKVAGAIDQAMKRLNFNCSSLRFTPNLADPALYRITARYSAVADANMTLYRRV